MLQQRKRWDKAVARSRDWLNDDVL
jgi:hypothetical protein